METQNCKLISDLTIISGGKVLLVKYKDGNKYDHQTGWFLPDDLLNEFEDPDDSARRISAEQLGISDPEVKISFVESFQGKDKSWHIVFHYKIIIDSDIIINPSNEIEEFKWFEFNNLPDKKEIAHNGWAIYTLGQTLN